MDTRLEMENHPWKTETSFYNRTPQAKLGTSKTVNRFKCVYTNIDGLSSRKESLFSVLVNHENPHIIFLTETKLKLS